MCKPLELEGKSFGNLLVLERSENDKHGKTKWLCQCSCGNKKVVNSTELRSGDAKSCGCVRSMINRIRKYAYYINRTFEIENFHSDYGVCRDNRKNLFIKCKKCGFEKYTRSDRIITKHKCI